MIEQQFVEITARDLVRMVSLRSIRVFEIKLNSFVATGAEKFAAVLLQETGLVKFFQQIHACKGFHAEWQERFANMKARKFFPLKQDYPPTGTCKERRGSATSRATPNDGDVVHVNLHYGSMLAKFIPKQNFSNSEGRLGAHAENSSRTGISVRRVRYPENLC